MADDQATLGSFADATDGDGETGDPAGSDRVDGSNTDDGTVDEAGATLPGGGDRVCPWCLAAADRFVETGPTGLACGRCSAALPVGADWFDAREAVVRRPMYDTDG